ncbi:MAG: hypothetical protein JWR52_2813 [Marmoricola sp.]|nr:hypothetical protein [Marmoricola sp.]
MSTSKRVRITALAVAGLAALQLAWIAVMIPYFGIDEFDHGYRASSVAAGHWTVTGHGVPTKLGRGDLISVRADVAAAAKPACDARPYTGPWNCNAVRSAGPGRVLIASAAARYNPAYYAVVGTVAAPWHGNANLVVMRVMTALLSAALFGLAVWVLLGISRSVWPVAAVLLSALPTTVYSSAVAAPNGVEMFAGIALWACLLALFEGAVARRERALAYAGAALSGAVVANTHTLGLLWCALTAVVVVLAYGPGRAWRTLRPRRGWEWVAGLGLVAGAAYELGWVLTSHVNDPTTVGGNFTASPWPSVVDGILLWPFQAIGAVPLRDEPAPTLTLALFAAALLALLVGALRRSGLRSRRSISILSVLGLSYVVPTVLTVRTYHLTGAIWQGRYAAPFVVGAFLLAGIALDRAPAIRPRLVAVLLGAGVLAVSVGNLTTLIAITRVQGRLTELLAATSWSLPAAVVLVLSCLLSGGCWWAAVNSCAPAVGPTPEGAHGHDRPLAAVLR